MLFTTNVDAMHVVWHGSLPVHLKSINCNYLCSCDQGGTLPTKITPQEIMDHDAFRNSGDIMMMMMLMAYDRRPYDYDEDDDDRGMSQKTQTQTQEVLVLALDILTTCHVSGGNFFLPYRTQEKIVLEF